MSTENENTAKDVATHAMDMHRDLERIGVGTEAAQDRIDEFARLAFAAGQKHGAASVRPPLVAVSPDAGSILAGLNATRAFVEKVVRNARKFIPEAWQGALIEESELHLGNIDRACDFVLRGPSK